MIVWPVLAAEEGHEQGEDEAQADDGEPHRVESIVLGPGRYSGFIGRPCAWIRVSPCYLGKSVDGTCAEEIVNGIYYRRRVLKILFIYLASMFVKILSISISISIHPHLWRPLQSTWPQSRYQHPTATLASGPVCSLDPATFLSLAPHIGYLLSEHLLRTCGTHTETLNLVIFLNIFLLYYNSFDELDYFLEWSTRRLLSNECVSH